MTREEILSMEPGPEMDAAVAELVMGLEVLGIVEVYRSPDCCSEYLIPYEAEYGAMMAMRPVYIAGCLCGEGLRHPTDIDYGGHFAGCLEVVGDYSTGIATAWEVVEKFRRGGDGRAACCADIRIYDDLVPEDIEVAIWGPNTAMVSALGKEAPEAICKAALLAGLEA